MLSPGRMKIVKTVILVSLIALVLVPPAYRTLFESVPFRAADEAGNAYVDRAFDRALVAFALARATNAIISVIQDSEIDIAPAGIGVTIAIGEALDPVNDMIERFSWVMLVSLVSLGIQKLLIEIAPWISVKFILLPALALLLAGLWVGRERARRLNHYGVRLVFLAVLIRFCIPAVALVNEQAYGLFLDRHYVSAVEGVEQGNAALRSMDPTAPGAVPGQGEGFWSDLRKRAGRVIDVVDLQNRVNRMKARLSGMIENMLKMIAVFLLNTVLLPVGFLWLLVRPFRMVSGGGSAERLEQLLLRRIVGGAAPATLASETVHPGGDGQDAEIDEKDENVKSDQ